MYIIQLILEFLFGDKGLQRSPKEAKGCYSGIKKAKGAQMTTREEVESVIAELYDEGRAGNMFSEASAQWLESCLEEENPDYDDLIHGDLPGWTAYWLRGMVADIEAAELEPGGLYHWMVQALDSYEGT